MHRSLFVILLVVSAGLSPIAEAAAGETAAPQSPQIQTPEPEQESDLRSGTAAEVQDQLPPWWLEGKPEKASEFISRRTMYRLLGEHSKGWAIGSIAVPLGVSGGALLIGAIAAPTDNFGSSTGFVISSAVILASSFVFSLPVWANIGIALAMVRDAKNSRRLAKRFLALSAASGWTALALGLTTTLSLILAAAGGGFALTMVAAGTGLATVMLSFPGAFFRVLANQALGSSGRTSSSLHSPRRPPAPRVIAAGPTGLTLAF